MGRSRVRIQTFLTGPNTTVGSTVCVRPVLFTDREIKWPECLLPCGPPVSPSRTNHSAPNTSIELCTLFNANKQGGGWGKILECGRGEQ